MVYSVSLEIKVMEEADTAVQLKNIVKNNVFLFSCQNCG